METTSEPTRDAIVHLTLDAFEGPLDLLLHLIQKHEIDVFDIPVAVVTEKYLAYLDLMRTLNLDVAGEYLLMAATLTHIKSQMLLPKPEPLPGEEPEVDPREELVRRLLEYQKYKDAAAQLTARPVLGRDTFARAPVLDGVAGEDELSGGLVEVGIYALVDAMSRVIERVGKDLAHEVRPEGISIMVRMREICERFMAVKSVVFDELFEGKIARADVVVTFLALLELCRLRVVKLYQRSKDDVLHIVRAVEEMGEAELGMLSEADAGAEAGPVAEVGSREPAAGSGGAA
ncbi:MAG: segregation/condensation protein A [Deltaproteobacteria bacterium]|nr:segregation/condensation protein A [Deltaproteobacteria bacterium]